MTERPPRPFGIDWGEGYAIFAPPDPICGFILNPDAQKIHELEFCKRPAVYGFRFRNEDPRDFATALGGWQGVCAEHAAVIREWDAVSEMWSL